MHKKTAGIHHITAIVGHPQENVDFYAGVLGLRLVKQTVNFDDPGTYHFYFGDAEGTPGTLITFFPWSGARPGRIGDGQVGVTSYAIPKGAMPFWKERLQKFDVPFTRQERFGEPVLTLKDPHGLILDLVERNEGKINTWSFGGVTPDVAIKGFAGGILYSSQPEQTGELLENLMGFKKVDEDSDCIRFRSSADIGNTVDVRKTPGIRGQMGAGTVHHIAFRARDDADQQEWKAHLSSNGYIVTPVQDRNYFNSIYFREHGDILFEIATDPPGFAIDESKEELGSSLKLPEQYEPHREKIEKVLLPFEVRELD
ncbi:glyoxalase family protein [Melghiribacillus thermohalophilus]|uniref:Glyoxalase family protein n=1 Tax=Melghiribacillus thermohalophilus TaxID=1324956 RepID=A0A4R3MV24_9BACI|nr:ring-cleaving dioxygenase [Melghiribacillus thermohalophilus]TCT19346.1 glyoxalase family protein [Melghiribacillus thermohalophilus]